MCIICVKNKGIAMPTKSVIETMFDNNNDGAGYMYNESGNVVIRKGFMTCQSLLDSLKEIKDINNKSVILHFRISTSGNVDKGACHPYPVTNDFKLLRATRTKTKLGIAHNGIISDYTPEFGSILNDTQTFIQEVVSPLYDSNKLFLKDKRYLKMLEVLAGSKLAFMNERGKVTTIGNFEEVGGLLYSNSSYRTYRTTISYDSYYGYKDLDNQYDYSCEDYEIKNNIHYMDSNGISQYLEVNEDDSVLLLDYDFNLMRYTDSGYELIDEDIVPIHIDDEAFY